MEGISRPTAMYAAPRVPERVYRNGPRLLPLFGPERTRSGVGKFARGRT